MQKQEAHPMEGYPTRQMRRLRYNPTLRQMLAGVRLRRDELIAPIFVSQLVRQRREISSMPGVYQRPLPDAADHAAALAEKGIRAVLLFGIPSEKDASGSGAWDEEGIVQQAIRLIRQTCPELLIIADTCLCEYTEHGHCGPLVEVRGRAEVDNCGALAALARTAVSQARAGADVIAPSAMMDGQVKTIRAGLDAASFERVPILSYAVKFASSLYGPFREAAESTPKQGDRRSYQMDPLSPRQILAEARADLAEGADLLMVKPAACYLDVISLLSGQTDAPLAAYHVSGEYAMIKLAAAAGAVRERDAVLEITSAIKRAGADLIITYYAEQLAEWI
jgi:porphobilinogen synthase